MRIYLAVISAYDVGGASATTLYYGTKGYVTGPSETPANTHFAPRIKQPAVMSRDMFANGTTFGKSRVGYGDLVLFNGDGALDALLGYAFDGRTITIYMGEDDAAFPGGFTKLLVGTMEQVEVGVETVTIRIRDRQLSLEVPLQDTLYAGSNSLPNGLEGVAGDLKGKPKPICYGAVTNIAPPCVNTSKLIYQVNDGAVSDISDVYDAGLELGIALPPTWTTTEMDVYLNYDDMFGVGYGNGIWVVASPGVVWVSTDLELWTQFWLPAAPGGVANWKRVSYGAGLFMASGDVGGLAYSPNGIVWTDTSPFTGTDNVGRAAYSSSLDIWAVGGTGGVLYTSDGTGYTWTARTSNVTGEITDIHWDAGQALFVLVTATDEVAYSSNGTTWTAGTTPGLGTNWKAVTYSDTASLWIAVGTSIMTATTPSGTWTTRTIPAPLATVYDVVETPWGVVAGACNGGYTIYSTDGTSWTKGNNDWSGFNVYGLATDGQVVVGTSDTRLIGVWAKGPSIAYATSTDLLDDSLAPPPGGYGVYLTGGLFRLGSTPAGTVTANVVQGAAASDRTAAQLWTDVLTAAGMTSADWSAADVTNTDTANASVIGYWSGLEPVNCDVVASKIMGSIGAWWGVDRTGIFRTKILTDPNGETAAFTFKATDMVRPLTRIPVNDPGKGIPIWRQVIRYGRNYTVQTNDLAGGVTDARRAALSHEWLEESDETASVKTAYLLAREQVDETLLTTAANAATEADRRLTLRDSRRDLFEFTVQLTETNATVDLGSYVNITHSRYGLSAGKVFVCVGVDPDAANNVLTLRVWG